MEQTKIETKVCNVCHRELPLSNFHRCKKNKDGYQYACKECQKAKNSEHTRNIALLKAKIDMGLAGYTPRELMAELKRRGYTGKLQYTEVKEIDLSLID